MIDPARWDFEDAAGSEQRFRDAASAATGDDARVLLTQVARALGLQELYAESHALLDTLASHAPEVRTGAPWNAVDSYGRRGWTGRGRRSRRRPAIAAGAGMEALRVDALPMVALVADP